MAAAGGGGQDQGSDKNSYYILWVIGLVSGIAAMIWYFFSIPLKKFFIALRLYELTVIDFVVNLIPSDLPWIGDQVQQTSMEVAGDLSIAKMITPDTLTLDIASELSTVTGTYLRYPLVLYFIFLVYIVYKTNVHVRLRKKFNMQSLAKQEQVNWPQIKVVTRMDLLEEDVDSGPWAMAMTPMQFAKKNKLVTIEPAEGASSSFSKSQVAQYKVTLNRARTERAFSAQLGRSWHGVEAMAPHRRAIFGIFVGRGGRDTKAAQAMVAQLATSAADGKLDCRGADDLWKKQMKNKRVQELCQNHAFEFTLMISALQFAREDGVLASSDFLWVKPIDRRLWYVINNVGRQTPGVEVGGIFSHWYNEMALRRPLSVPKVREAVDALELAISDIIYTPDDKEKEEIKKRYEAKQQAAASSSSSEALA